MMATIVHAIGSIAHQFGERPDMGPDEIAQRITDYAERCGIIMNLNGIRNDFETAMRNQPEGDLHSWAAEAFSD